MRAAMSCVLALMAVTLAGAMSGAPEHSANSVTAAHLSRCAKPANANDERARAKPSSFAPHAGSRSRAYGAPIQSRILKSRPKKNPQLKSTALPDA
jgi:hypothetical protein